MSIYSQIQWPPVSRDLFLKTFVQFFLIPPLSVRTFQHVAGLVQGVIDAIPSDWRVSPELLGSYPAGSDVRPLASKCGLLTSRELEITDTSKDATSLLEDLASGSVSAEEAVTAYAKRAAVAHQAVTCLAGFYYEDARKRAIELDQILKTTGKAVGPLHGELAYSTL